MAKSDVGSKKKYPKRSRSHKTGDRAVRVFNHLVPREWAINSSESDYGWDLRVNIVYEEDVREEFSVQVKGTDSPNYIRNRSALSQPLSVSTINLLHERIGPSMICVCHTSTHEEPIYWVWLDEAIKEIENTNPDWQLQETVSIRIPTSQVLSKKSGEQIEAYVRDCYDEIKIKQAIGDLIVPDIRDIPRDALRSYGDQPKEYVVSKFVPSLRDAGLLDAYEKDDEDKIESYTPTDQERFRKISEASAFLTRFNDREAHRILYQLEDKIEDSSDGIRARYFNCIGVLFLHQANYDSALSCFVKATELRPIDKKYVTNLLLVEELLSSQEESKKPLPDGWSTRLDQIIDKFPDYIQALRLKARYLAKSKCPEEAEHLLRSSPIWKNEQEDTLGYLADIYLHNGQINKALSLLEEAKVLKEEHDAIFWSQLGYTFLCRVLKDAGIDDFFVRGFGPQKIELEHLLSAKASYDKAIKEYASKGYPHISETAVVNQTLILLLLNESFEAERLCTNYLELNPDAPEVCSALVSSLCHRGKYPEAVRYARIAFSAKPNSKPDFRKLALLLFAIEDFDDLLDLISQRGKSGFVDKDEEGISREMLSIVYFELGDEDLAEEQIVYMKSDKELSVHATLAEASIARKRGDTKEDIISMYKDALNENPNNEKLLTFLVQEMLPVTEENAGEIAEALQIVSLVRELAPIEYSIFGNAFLFLQHPDQALQIFEKALVRYPYNQDYHVEKANALVQLGDEDSAYGVLKEYLKTGVKNYNLIRNMAILAVNTDRLDEAIKLFQLALNKTEDQNEKGLINCHLWELRRRHKDLPKDILRHAIEFGKTVKDDIEGEARFLTMCMITSCFIKREMVDDEVNKWFEEIKNRAQAFTEKYPKYEGFIKFSTPKDIPDEERAMHLIADIYSVMLPYHLRTVPFQMSIRNTPFPLALRSKILAEASSIFEYWDICTKSKDFSHAIHIWNDSNDLDKERLNAIKDMQVCVDLTAILTLSELGLLQTFTNSFDRIIISRGSKIALDQALYDPIRPNGTAEKIEKWRLDNRKKIRVRNKGISSKHNGTSKISNKIEAKIIQQEKSEYGIDELIGDGVGESLIVAQANNIPLYTDESVIRQWAENDFKVKSFSTLSFFNRLREGGKISLGEIIKSYAQLINKNYRIIPFFPLCFHERLKEIIIERKSMGCALPKRDDLIDDHILGTFLKQYAESSLSIEPLHRIIIIWWSLILNDSELKRELSQSDIDSTLIECMIFPSFSLSNRTVSGVLMGIAMDEPFDRLAVLLSKFLWAVYKSKSRKENTLRVWSAIKSTCERLFRNNETNYDRVLFEFIPKWLALIIENDHTLDKNQKLSHLISLPQYFSDPDKNKFEYYFHQNKPSFMK